jgi:ribosomal subunit interface protein
LQRPEEHVSFFLDLASREKPMEIPLQITFRNLVPSPAVETRIREKAKRLERFHERITGCRVVVEAPHRQHQQGMLYRVAIDLTVPGAELVINREAGDNHAHEDIYIAIRDAFDALQRRLRDFARRRRGEVRSHGESAPPE